MKTNYLFIISLSLISFKGLGQSQTSLVSIPVNQYGQHGINGDYSNCDTVGKGRTMDLNSTKLAFFLQQRPDTFSLFVVENIRNYPTKTSTYDTLTFSKVSNKYTYTKKTGNPESILQVPNNPVQYKLIYALPLFSSYQQWKNSFVQIHFKVKGNNSLYTVKDTTKRENIISPINLTVKGLLMSSGNNNNNLDWHVLLGTRDTFFFNIAIIPLLTDGTYYADKDSRYYDYVNIGDGRTISACTTQKRLTYKAIKDSTGNGLLQVPLQNGAIYQWYFEGDSIKNATSNKYQATKSGTYSVTANFDFILASSNFRTEGNNMVTATYSYNYISTVTALETNSIEYKEKNLVKIYTSLGQEIKERDAFDGMFIYKYSDGSTRKVMKVE